MTPVDAEDSVEAQQASDSGGVQVNGAGNEIVMTMETANPLVPLAPPIHAVMDITVNNGTLQFSCQTTFFPSIAISVTRGRVQDTDIVNDADCLDQFDTLGALGVANTAAGLYNFNNKGNLTVESNSAPGTIDRGDAKLC